MDEVTNFVYIGGKFSRPNKGHYLFIKKYIDLIDADDFIIIFIENDKNEAIKSEKILKIFFKNYNNFNVIICEKDKIKEMKDFSSLIDVEGNVIIGTSKSSEEISKYKEVKEYIDSNCPNLTCLSPEIYAISLTLSSSDDITVNYDKNNLPDNLTKKDEEEIKNILME